MGFKRRIERARKTVIMAQAFLDCLDDNYEVVVWESHVQISVTSTVALYALIKKLNASHPMFNPVMDTVWETEATEKARYASYRCKRYPYIEIWQVMPY